MKIHRPMHFPIHQRGLVLEIVLVVLVALLLASVALFRSVDTSSTVAGNIAFKSDANNRAQLAFDRVIAWATLPSNFNTYIDQGADLPNRNYSARMLQVNDKGIPVILQDASAFDTKFTDNPPATALLNTVATDGIRVRYLIERMCTNDGPLNDNHCTYTYKRDPSRPVRPRYDDRDKPALRVTVRVDGPRNTLSYVQATVSP